MHLLDVNPNPLAYNIDHLIVILFQLYFHALKMSFLTDFEAGLYCILVSVLWNFFFNFPL